MNAEQFQQILSTLMDSQQAMIDKIQQLSGNPSVSTNSTVFIPTFENFNAQKEDFRTYRERFENYLKLKNVSENNEFSKDLILNSVGPSTYKLLTSLVAPKSPNDLTYQELIKNLKITSLLRKTFLFLSINFYLIINKKINQFQITLQPLNIIH